MTDCSSLTALDFVNVQLNFVVFISRAWSLRSCPNTAADSSSHSACEAASMSPTLLCGNLSLSLTLIVARWPLWRLCVNCFRFC